MLMMVCDEEKEASENTRRKNGAYNSTSYKSVKNLTKLQKQNLINHIKKNLKQQNLTDSSIRSMKAEVQQMAQE